MSRQRLNSTDFRATIRLGVIANSDHAEPEKNDHYDVSVPTPHEVGNVVRWAIDSLFNRLHRVSVKVQLEANQEQLVEHVPMLNATEGLLGFLLPPAAGQRVLCVQTSPNVDAGSIVVIGAVDPSLHDRDTIDKVTRTNAPQLGLKQ